MKCVQGRHRERFGARYFLDQVVSRPGVPCRGPGNSGAALNRAETGIASPEFLLRGGSRRPGKTRSARKGKAMIQKLSVKQVLSILSATPEQALFDWKRDLNLDEGEKKSELIKDIAAIANATVAGPGFVFYGVDPRLPDPVVGMSKNYDDATLQQIVEGKVEPRVDFLYYDDLHQNGKRIGVLHVPPSAKRPHIIARDVGKLREGQVLVRCGSSTRGVTPNELMAMYYSKTNPQFILLVKWIEQQVRSQVTGRSEMQDQLDYMKFLIRQAEVTSGLPPGSLGSR